MIFSNFPATTGLFFPTGSINYPYLEYSGIETIPVPKDFAHCEYITFSARARAIDWHKLSDDEKMKVCLNDNSVISEYGEVYQAIEVVRPNSKVLYEYLAYYRVNPLSRTSPESAKAVRLGDDVIGNDFISRLTGKPVNAMISFTKGSESIVLANAPGSACIRITAAQIRDFESKTPWYMTRMLDLAASLDIEDRSLYTTREDYDSYVEDKLGVYLRSSVLKEHKDRAWEVYQKEGIGPNTYYVETIHEIV